MLCYLPSLLLMWTCLCDSVCLMVSQVHAHIFYDGQPHVRNCLTRGDCCPPGEGCNRAGPYNQEEEWVLQLILYRAQKEWWVKTSARSVQTKLLFTQDAVQDAYASKCILKCAAVDLKEAIFMSPFLRHHPFIRCGFEGRAWQYKVLPVGLFLSLRVFTIRMLNYLDNWLILALSQDQLIMHRDRVLQHLNQLGLWVNREKSKFSPLQSISYVEMELVSITMTVCLTEERARLVLCCLSVLDRNTVFPDVLAHSWPLGMRKYAFPPVSLLAQTLFEVRKEEVQVLLVAPFWFNWTWVSELTLHATVPPWHILLREDLLSQLPGTIWHPWPDLWNLHVWSIEGARKT
ncbi:uncharacterized protein [Danio rerio]|uniref:Uncharacterized protein n=1 Tax=Danio rerio TaxID=7955 RepID=A0AC58J3K3_DANRE